MEQNFKHNLFGKLLNLFQLFNKFPTFLTDKKDVLNLIQGLHPKNTDKELVRLGSIGDGGYLIPNDLENIEACFSPGVSSNSDFELDCANRGMKVFLADKSVDGPAVQNKSFQFQKKFIGAITNESFMTINDWIKSSDLRADSDLILQMDIEGFEYETFLSMTDEVIKRFRIMVVEFHLLNHIWNKPFYNLVNSTLEKIKQTHTCVHIHPNNANPSLKYNGIGIPSLLEFSFLRNDRIIHANYSSTFPHALDTKNVENKPDIILPGNWIHS